MGFTGRKTLVMNSLLLIIMLAVDVGMKCRQWKRSYEFPAILNSLILGLSISILLNLVLSFGKSYHSTHIGIYRILFLLIGVCSSVSLYSHGKSVGFTKGPINSDHIYLVVLPFGIIFPVISLFTLRPSEDGEDDDILNDEESCVGSITSRDDNKQPPQPLETIHEEDIHKCEVSPYSTLKTQLSVASSLGITGQADVPAGHQSPGLPVKQSLSMGGQLMGSRITGGSGSSLVTP